MNYSTHRLFFVLIALFGLVTSPWAGFAGDLPADGPDAEAPLAAAADQEESSSPTERLAAPRRPSRHEPYISAAKGCMAVIAVLGLGLSFSFGGRYVIKHAVRRILSPPAVKQVKPDTTKSSGPKKTSLAH